MQMCACADVCMCAAVLIPKHTTATALSPKHYHLLLSDNISSVLRLENVDNHNFIDCYFKNSF